MLDARDEKLVKKYYLLPKVAWYALAALFPTGALTILLVMIDNIALGSSGFGDLQLVVMIALMIAEGALCIACGVAAKVGLRREHWQELERAAMGANADTSMNDAVVGGIGVAAGGCLIDAIGGDDLDALGKGLEIAGGAMTAYGFFETMNRMSKAAAAVGHAFGVKLPGLGRTRLAVLGLPLLILVLAFVPRLMESASQTSAAQEAAAQTLAAVARALEPTCDRVSADDPFEQRRDSGYNVTGWLTDEDDENIANITVETDETGLVTGVIYSSEVDIERTTKENLAQAEQAFARFHSALATSAPADTALGGESFAYADMGLAAAPNLPEEFCQAFLANDYYTELDVDMEDMGTLRAWALFSTEPEDEFDEYTDTSISIYLQARTY